MTEKHTPGPWSVGRKTEFINQVFIVPAIGCCYGAGDELMANARLIAAAPDLLEFAMRVCYGDSDGIRPLIAQGKEAIKKATGAA